jgi:photosystem II stability/assembly factor-like uncharacterized protein
MVHDDAAFYPSARWFCKSTDNGATWDTLADFAKLFKLPYTCGMTMNSRGHIFVGGAANTILKSTDKGITWKMVNPPNGTTNGSSGKTPTIKFSKNHPDIGFASALTDEGKPGSGGILRTIDGGESWKKIAFADTSIWGMEVVDRGSSIEIMAGGYMQGLDHADAFGGKFFLVVQSKDGGETWTKLNNANSVYNIKYNPAHPHGREYFFATGGGLLIYSPNGVGVEEDTTSKAEQPGIPFSEFYREYNYSTSIDELSLYTINGERVLYQKAGDLLAINPEFLRQSAGVYLCVIQGRDGKRLLRTLINY